LGGRSNNGGVVPVHSARDGGKAVVVRENVVLGDAELEVKDIQKLALDAPNVALAKDAGADRPVDVLQRRIVQIFGSDDEGAKKDALQCPLLEGNVEVGLGPVDVYKRRQDDWGSDLRADYDVGHECRERLDLARGSGAGLVGRGGGAAHGVVNSFDDSSDNIVYDCGGKLEVEEVKEGGRV
jgi:hypothetical protein